MQGLQQPGLECEGVACGIERAGQRGAAQQRRREAGGIGAERSHAHGEAFAVHEGVVATRGREGLAHGCEAIVALLLVRQPYGGHRSGADKQGAAGAQLELKALRRVVGEGREGRGAIGPVGRARCTVHQPVEAGTVGQVGLAGQCGVGGDEIGQRAAPFAEVAAGGRLLLPEIARERGE